MTPCATCQHPVFCIEKGECYYGQPARTKADEKPVVKVPIALRVSEEELGMIALALHQLDPSTHRAEFFRLRGQITKFWSESMPDQYRMAMLRGEVQPWGLDWKAGKTVSDESTVVRETFVADGKLSESVARCPERHLGNWIERLPDIPVTPARFQFRAPPGQDVTFADSRTHDADAPGWLSEEELNAFIARHR